VKYVKCIHKLCSLFQLNPTYLHVIFILH
jgi:hypothetical protein